MKKGENEIQRCIRKIDLSETRKKLMEEIIECILISESDFGEHKGMILDKDMDTVIRTAAENRESAAHTKLRRAFSRCIPKAFITEDGMTVDVDEWMERLSSGEIDVFGNLDGIEINVVEYRRNLPVPYLPSVSYEENMKWVKERQDAGLPATIDERTVRWMIECILSGKIRQYGSIMERCRKEAESADGIIDRFGKDMRTLNAKAALDMAMDIRDELESVISVADHRDMGIWSCSVAPSIIAKSMKEEI